MVDVEVEVVMTLEVEVVMTSPSPSSSKHRRQGETPLRETGDWVVSSKLPLLDGGLAFQEATSQNRL